MTRLTDEPGNGRLIRDHRGKRRHAKRAVGISSKPMTARSVEVVQLYYRAIETDQRIKLVGWQPVWVMPHHPGHRSRAALTRRPAAAAASRAAATQAQVTEPDQSVYWENCTAPNNAGVYDIPRGAPGYRPKLDRNNDGVACESD